MLTLTLTLPLECSSGTQHGRAQAGIGRGWIYGTDGISGMVMDGQAGSPNLKLVRGSELTSQMPSNGGVVFSSKLFAYHHHQQ